MLRWTELALPPGQEDVWGQWRGWKGLLENQGLDRSLEVGFPTCFLSAYLWILLFHKLERAPHFRWSAPQHSKTMTTVPTMLGKTLGSPSKWRVRDCDEHSTDVRGQKG